ncbi:MAG: hypothetical protein ACTSWY_13830 [Promethearchaeota archaeon]
MSYPGSEEESLGNINPLSITLIVIGVLIGVVSFSAIVIKIVIKKRKKTQYAGISSFGNNLFSILLFFLSILSIYTLITKES